MFCDNPSVTAWICIGALYAVHGVVQDQMPSCPGTWEPLPDPIPPAPGEYEYVYTAQVEADGPVDTLQVMVDGSVVAVLHRGETRNWTCVSATPYRGS